MIKDIIVLSDVRAKGVFIAYAQIVGVTVKESSIEISKLYESVKRKILSTFTLNSLRENPIVKAYRRFYWSIGIDPTKQRPSSEALIRRILRGLDIPSVNNVVDIGNIVSMETLIPIGIYDLDKVKGETLYLRMSRSGEVFHPIGGSVEILGSGQIVLADNEKILHVYPYRDSEFTKVTRSTRNILIISCGVPGVNKSLVREALDRVVQNIIRYAGGELIGVRVA